MPIRMPPSRHRRRTHQKLKSQGYDGIYFRGSDTQEGELVVFDKEKVKFEENNTNLVEDKAENEYINTKHIDNLLKLI